MTEPNMAVKKSLSLRAASCGLGRFGGASVQKQTWYNASALQRLVLVGWLALTVSIRSFGQPAVIQFSSTNYAVNETVRVATITVEINWGDPMDTYAVEYTTSNGTARAALDYVPTSGTLSFQWPETIKTFDVPILADGLWEGDETLMLSLANPQDPDFEPGDAVLGSVSNALLTIAANDDPLDYWILRSTSPSNDITAGVFANNIFVAVGSAGTIQTSTDGIAWNNQASGTAAFLGGIAYGQNTFVAVGESGAILTSVEGVTWSNRVSATPERLRAVAYGNGFFVAVGGSNILSSSDGLNWTKQDSLGCPNWSGVTYGSGIFVAVGSVCYWEDCTNWVATSFDGVRWTRQTSGLKQTPDYPRMHHIAYGNGTFVAVGNLRNLVGDFTFRALSTNGVDWAVLEGFWFGHCESLGFGGGVFSEADYWLTGGVRTSTDGIVWDTHYTGINEYLYGVTYGNGRFVAFGSRGAILHSGDTRPRFNPPGITDTPSRAMGLVVENIRPATSITIEESEDFVTWIPLVTLTNETGSIEFTDTSNRSRRFYRALAR